MSYQTFINEVNINDNRLDYRYLTHFKENNLLNNVTSLLCEEAIISKKEYAETMEMIRIIQRYIPNSKELTAYDICGGHGLTGILLALISKNITKSTIIDLKESLAHKKILNCLNHKYPQLKDKIVYINEDYENISFSENSILISIHACGIRTDNIMNIAINKRVPCFIIPCCYKKKSLPEYLQQYLNIFSLKDLVDFHRIEKIKQNNFKIYVKQISQKITDMNRLFILIPQEFSLK